MYKLHLNKFQPYFSADWIKRSAANPLKNVRGLFKNLTTKSYVTRCLPISFRKQVFTYYSKWKQAVAYFRHSLALKEEK